MFSQTLPVIVFIRHKIIVEWAILSWEPLKHFHVKDYVGDAHLYDFVRKLCSHVIAQ
jgi:hypothetical protein